MNPPALPHVPVLLDEVIDYLAADLASPVTLVDATAGRGGHALALAERLPPGSRLIALDADPLNADAARERLAPLADRVDITVLHRNFATLGAALAELGVARVDRLLADLGFASNQVDDPSRGLSFQEDGPLDMRLDPTSGAPAADLVNHLPEAELADLIYQFGEERASRRIARKVVEARGKQPINTTLELAQVVREALRVPAAKLRKARGARKGRGLRQDRIDPATRTFMALRIAVNQELAALDALLAGLPGWMAPGGRAAVISFHSLEDRRVKHAFRAMAQAGQVEVLTRKPVIASDAERATNPRSRSAKLRVAAFL